MKNALIEKGVGKNQICVTGIPINPVFWNTLSNQEIDETYNEFQIPKNKKNFIFFGGGEFGLSNTINIEIFKKLAKSRNKCVIVVTHSKEVADEADYVLEIKDKKLIKK